MELEKLKQLLGVPVEDTEHDVALEFILIDVEETIKNYCNVEELPQGLINTAYRMAIDLYRNENIGQEDAAIGAVASISEGDTTTSFQKCVDENFKNTLLKDYRHMLNRYRKVVF